jgi:hypothetical protein
MGRPLRHIKDNAIVEVTSRTIQERLLLRPSKEANEIILGILGRALEKHPGIKLHGFVILSNHFHLLLTALYLELLCGFMGFVKSNIARKVGKLHDWDGVFWGERYVAIPVLDEVAQLDRQQYIMSHGCKEGLVADPLDWPGAKSAGVLVNGETLKGTWYDGTAIYRAKSAGKEVDPKEHAIEYDVPITPLPCLSDLSEQDRRTIYAEMRDEQCEAVRARVAATGKEPLGVERILSAHPHSRPRKSKRSPAPLCHASSRKLRTQYRDEHTAFVDAYRQASEQFRSGNLCVEFPGCCFRPSLPPLFAIAASTPNTTHSSDPPAAATVDSDDSLPVGARDQAPTVKATRPCRNRLATGPPHNLQDRRLR